MPQTKWVNAWRYHLFAIIFSCGAVFWCNDYQSSKLNNVIEIPKASLSAFSSSKLLQKTYDLLCTDFEAVLGTENHWKSLKFQKNISIETYDGGVGLWPVYVRTTMVIDKPVHDVYKLFTYENFAKTQNYIDPFYESSTQVNIDKQSVDKIIKKVTKPPLYRKRLFTLALLERKQGQNFEVRFPINSVGMSSQLDKKQLMSSNKHNYYVVPKGTPVIAMFSVNNTNDNSIDQDYIEARQQFIAWFIERDQKRSTHLEILMRVDLGLDIPRWLFLQTVGITGIWAMSKLLKLL